MPSVGKFNRFLSRFILYNSFLLYSLCRDIVFAMYASYIHPSQQPYCPIPHDLLLTMEHLVSPKGDLYYRDKDTGYVYGFLRGHLVCRSHILAAIGLPIGDVLSLVKCYASVGAPHVCAAVPLPEEIRYLRINAEFAHSCAVVSDIGALSSLFCRAVELVGNYEDCDPNLFSLASIDGHRAAVTGRPFPGWPKVGPGQARRIKQKNFDVDDAYVDLDLQSRHVLLRRSSYLVYP